MPANRDLVAAARAGDKEAFGALYAAIYTDLYKFAYYLLKNEEDAKDAVSDAVMDAYAGISKLRSEEAFKSWMFHILSAKWQAQAQRVRDPRAQFPPGGRRRPGRQRQGRVPRTEKRL